MDQLAQYICPACGELIEVGVDPSGGREQDYIEDCPVCCRPNRVRVAFDRDGHASVQVEPA